MKYSKILCIVLTLLFFVGCGKPEAATPNYTAFYESCKPNAESELISTLHKDDYALLYYGGLGSSLGLYKISIDGETVTPLACAGGDEALSGGISINHLEAEGKHIYFGTFSDTHWNPADDSVLDTDWTILRIEKEHTPGVEDLSIMEITAAANTIFLFTLSAPLADFEGINAEGETFLDMDTYLEQGYTITETAFIPVNS